MSRVIRACIDRKLVPNRETTERLALLKGTRWDAGSTLHVAFMGGDARTQEKVERVAQEWTLHANLKLRFGDSPKAQIRIAFQPGGSWSYVGTECLTIPKDQPTMNLGWLHPDTEDDEYSRVVLHEFGHALGCIHEHRSPAAGIQWNERAVLDYYAGPPNHWDEAATRSNVLETYSQTDVPPRREQRSAYILLKELRIWGPQAAVRRDNTGAGRAGNTFNTSCCGLSQRVGSLHKPSLGSARLTSRTASRRSTASRTVRPSGWTRRLSSRTSLSASMETRA